MAPTCPYSKVEYKTTKPISDRRIRKYIDIYLHIIQPMIAIKCEP